MARPAGRPRKVTQSPKTGGQPTGKSSEPQNALVPSDSVEILKKLGVDLQQPEQVMQFAATFQTSVSSSPYPSPDMLFAYDPHKPGFSNDIIAVIDGQRHHRQQLEVERTRRRERHLDVAQRNAFIVAILGIFLAAGGSFAGVDKSVCIAIALISVGGPNAATVISRFVKPRE